MQIEVQSSCGKSYSSPADPSTSVYDLHKRQSEETGMEIAEQQLVTADDATLKCNQLLSEVRLD